MQLPMHNLPNVHVLHAHDDIVVLIQECSVKVNDVFGIAAVHDLELAHDSLPHFLLGFHMDNL